MSVQHKLPAVRPPLPRKGPWPWVGAGAGALLLAGGVLWWGLSRPQRNAAKAHPDDPEMVQLMKDSLALEEEFTRIRDNRTPTEADLRQLQRAIVLQQEWMEATGSAAPEQEQRLLDLNALYESAWVRSAINRTQSAEKAGREHLAAGRPDEALAELRTALGLQHQLNQRRGGAGRDLARETTLAQETERLEAAPLAAELARTTADGARLRDEQNNTDALVAYHRAHELQLRLNRKYGRTQFANLGNLEGLEREIATLESAPLQRQMQVLSEQAAETAARGESQEAAALFEQAAAIQQKLNADFPHSRHASVERHETLETARQTQLSVSAVEQLGRIDRELAARFRRRDLADVGEMLLQGARLQDALFARLPRSRLLDTELRLKFNYLLLHREVLGPVLDLVVDQLRPVPASDVQMLGTEVSQRLYGLVIGTNPSRQVGEALPVESLNVAEVEEFCRRLSWILGRPVRLPTLPEYRAALGEVPTGGSFAAQVWSQERSEGHTHEVSSTAPNAAGFSGLLGNVGEWLAPEAVGAAVAAVAGGSYADPQATIAEVPVVPLNRLERARTIGFRFVVE